MRQPTWNEFGAVVLAVLTLTAGSIAYAFDKFALRNDISARLDRIESKVDRLIEAYYHNPQSGK